MNLYVNDICIGLHSKCNWNCSYCIARDPKAIIDEDDIFNQIVPIKNRLGKLELSGGEPGLLSENFWNKLFNLTDHKLAICTNGTFIHNDYHIKFKNKIRSILVHCVPELDQDIHPKILQLKKEKVPYKLSFSIVVHNKNIHLLDAFLNKYSNIQFNLFFTDATFKPFHHNELYNYNIQPESGMELFKILANKSKYSQYTNILMKAILSKNFKYLNSWSAKNHEIKKFK